MLADTGASATNRPVCKMGVVEVEEAFYRAEFGAILADGVAAGSRVLVSPGTVVGTGARIGSGAAIRGSIDRDSKVI